MADHFTAVCRITRASCWHSVFMYETYYCNSGIPSKISWTILDMNTCSSISSPYRSLYLGKYVTSWFCSMWFEHASVFCGWLRYSTAIRNCIQMHVNINYLEKYNMTDLILRNPYNGFLRDTKQDNMSES